MYKYGIRGVKLKQLKSYLENRYQRNEVNGQITDWGKVEKGIPLIKILYINDIKKKYLT